MSRFIVPLLFVGILGIGCNKQTAQAQTQATDRQVELTVYTQDFAQVSETRSVELTDGTTRVRINDVSHLLDQDTVLYDFPKSDNSQVVSTTYDLGSETGQELLQNIVGQQVTLVYRSDSGREGDRQVGILEVASPGNIVVRVGDKLIVNPNATIEAQASEVATTPQLSAAVESKNAGKTPMQISYMTRGLSWGASYVFNLDPKSEDAEVELWATVTNNTGIEFPSASIKFVAGSPNRAVVPTVRASNQAGLAREDLKEKARWSDKDAEFELPEMVGELIAYPYKSQATLRNNQTNRVLMMSARKVKVSRDYAINLSSYGYRSDGRLKATLSLALKNSDESGLGQPLPMGSVRVYEPTDGGPAFIGAATIGDTPKDDRIDMTLTEVFNVYARTKTTETKKIDKRRTQYSYEVTVTNEKEKSVDIRLVQDFYGTWSMVDESVKSTRPNANRAQWIVSVPAGESKTLSYTVIVGY